MAEQNVPPSETFIELLKKALQQEFAFVMGLGITAEDESWEKAARGMAEKMGVRDGDNTGEVFILAFDMSVASTLLN